VPHSLETGAPIGATGRPIGKNVLERKTIVTSLRSSAFLSEGKPERGVASIRFRQPLKGEQRAFFSIEGAEEWVRQTAQTVASLRSLPNGKAPSALRARHITFACCLKSFANGAVLPQHVPSIGKGARGQQRGSPGSAVCQGNHKSRTKSRPARFFLRFGAADRFRGAKRGTSCLVNPH